MNKNTSISLGSYFDNFIQSSLASGRYKNVSEIIRAGLRLLEEEENRAKVLKEAIYEGMESGVDYAFDPEVHLSKLKKQKGNG
ncbi:MAG: antitoxin [Bacteroidetes bacterium GWF2_38_335]|nr:MAG: antitoxin [Bacteroidetes bacterium GWF2_38_335]OFY78043.1 MAG: antitoxin [Bacteroidetes bacterium RIFOXYA12_FULL_38_20]HBS88315.1 type II toxin-antitoxin system ParD family antitoxin [Bacteroidales bacterium]